MLLQSLHAAHARLTWNRARGIKDHFRLHCKKPCGVLNQDSITDKISSSSCSEDPYDLRPLFAVRNAAYPLVNFPKCTLHTDIFFPYLRMHIPASSGGSHYLIAMLVIHDTRSFSPLSLSLWSTLHSYRCIVTFISQILPSLSSVPCTHARLYCPCSQLRRIQKKAMPLFKLKDPQHSSRVRACNLSNAPSISIISHVFQLRVSTCGFIFGV